MSFFGYLEDIHHPAADPTRRLLNRYLKGRFSGLSLRAEEEKELEEAFDEARTSLRKSPLQV
jgi:hypothetical protein